MPQLVAKYIDKVYGIFVKCHIIAVSAVLQRSFVVLLIGLLILIGYATGLIIAASGMLFEGELEITKFLFLNLGLFLLELFLATLCFMFACMFDELKFSVRLGAGLGMMFFLVQMLSPG